MMRMALSRLRRTQTRRIADNLQAYISPTETRFESGMGNPNRAALLAKLQKVLKQHYKPVQPAQRPLLEQLLFACCLENANYEAAEKTYSRLVESFFDWNEVRVSTVTELAEVMKGLPDPNTAASNLKRVLQSVFESTYTFDLEAVKKEKIGQGIKRLESLEGASPFVVAFATQNALGGHAIPLDRGSAESLFIVGILTEAEAKPGSVASLERAIPKNKGVEFSSLLHQLGADFAANPHSPNVRNTLLSINPESKDRFPKRGVKKEPEKPVAKAPPASAAEQAASKSKGQPAGKKAPPPKKPTKTETPEKSAAAPKKKPSGKPAPQAASSKKSSTKQLTKRKPR